MISFIIWTVVILLVIQLSLLATLVVSKMNRSRDEEMLSNYLKACERPFFEFLKRESEECPDFPSDKRCRILLVERMLDRYVDQSNPSIDYTRVRESARTHLGDAYRLYIRRGSWAQRVNTLYYIEDFQMEDLRNDVWEHFLQLNENDEEYRQTLRVLSAFQDERLIRILLRSENIPQRLIKQMLRRFQEDLIEQMLALIEDEPGMVQRQVHLAVISYFGEVKDTKHLPFVEKMLAFPSKEVRLKSLRSLTEMKSCSDPALLNRFFDSEIWEERMYAAKLAGSLQLTSSKDSLIMLAGDPEWWVRYAACEAMKKLPEGDHLLAYTFHHHEDRFARSMARQHLSVKVGETA